MNDYVELSVIVPFSEMKREVNVEELYGAYKKGISEASDNYEFIFVLDGDFPKVFEALQSLKKRGEDIKIVKLAKWFGESTALFSGFQVSSGELIVTLPSYHQIDENEIPRVIKSIEGNDLVVACRWPRNDSLLNRFQSYAFHKFVHLMIGTKFHDLGSGVRVFKRKVLEEVQIYGDQHRFIPLLASRYGFRVQEVNVAQSGKDLFKRVYAPGVYVRRLLDLLSVFFLVKFTKKPLRFFGLSGLSIFSVGALLALFLFIQRMFFDQPLADRPIVLFSLLLIVLGIQLFAIGLVGEIIIFTHARELKEYTIEEIIN